MSSVSEASVINMQGQSPNKVPVCVWVSQLSCYRCLSGSVFKNKPAPRRRRVNKLLTCSFVISVQLKQSRLAILNTNTRSAKVNKNHVLYILTNNIIHFCGQKLYCHSNLCRSYVTSDRVLSWPSIIIIRYYEMNPDREKPSSLAVAASSMQMMTLNVFNRTLWD